MSAEERKLIVRFQGQLVQSVPLAEDMLTIGRTPDNGLSLPHPQIARHHAELRLEADQIILIDLGSSAGTFLGEARLLPNQPQLLPDGAVFRIGPFELTYQRGPADEASSPGLPPGNGVSVAPPPPRPPAPPRATSPAPRPIRPISGYLTHLPVVYHDADFLGRFLLIVEALWEPLEQRQDHIQMYFDPRTCPAALLPWLAGWLDLRLDPFWPESRQRALLTEAMDLIRWRGTRYGLSRIIELSTGVTPEILDEPGRPFVMRVRLTVPPEHPLDRQLVETLVQTHKPAYLGYILELR